MIRQAIPPWSNIGRIYPPSPQDLRLCSLIFYVDFVVLLAVIVLLSITCNFCLICKHFLKKKEIFCSLLSLLYLKQQRVCMTWYVLTRAQSGNLFWFPFEQCGMEKNKKSRYYFRFTSSQNFKFHSGVCTVLIILVTQLQFGIIT